ncbi:MAG: cofactor-independent phosphoglycerate mutase [Nanoarchaeota archaeon]|nr:cofactor-independent phosphoglycerate mutase [Nanoarchaeota archaeon]MBU1704710.1 cofactor-independent phosphoglycerate mutase [Nanoarchaeota archaeon]
MKYIIFLGDGMADYKIKKLGDKTPLMVANTPNMDSLAKKGRCGLFKTLPQGLPKGSAVANLSVLGYDPKQCFEGRGVLEAANQGIELDKNDVAMRCNLVCIEKGILKNHSAGHITNEEAEVLIKELDKKLGTDRIKFYPGVSYRHILVLKGYSKDIDCTPPHDVPGTPIKDIMVKGEEKTAQLLNNLILDSNKILKNHPINLKRAEQGKDKANYIWPWSAGKKPKMQEFKEKYGLKGAVISAVDLINGIGRYAGFDIITVKGATGLYDTNYEGKAAAVIENLKDHDFVFCHVEASDEASHEGDVDLKIKTIEYFDQRLIGNVLKRLDEIDDKVTIAVLPDHYNPCSVRTHTDEPVPFLIYKPDEEPDEVDHYDEETCKKGSLGLIEGENFIKLFLGKV